MKKFNKIVSTGLILSTLLMSTTSLFAGTKSGTAEVWAGVPLIGHVYVCIPYTATYQTIHVSNRTSNIVKEVETGESYTSAGLALITYQAYDSWGKCTGNSSYFDVYARGHCDFVFKGCPASLGLQTFTATEQVD